MKPQSHNTTATTLWQRLRQRPLLFHLLLIVATLTLLGVTAHLLMLTGTRHGARRTVPDFAGLPLSEAQHLAHKHDLELHINDSLYVPAYDGGIVLDQLPEEGVEVKPGRTVYITINSFQQRRVPVPYVAGRSLRQAKNMLEIAGLEIARLVYMNDMATNYVLAEFCDGQEVRPGSRIETEAGNGITLHVGVEGGYGTVLTPSVAGYTLRDAKSRIWESGLNVGRIEFDGDIDLLNQKEARVCLQTPTPEQRVALGSHVDLRLTLDDKQVSAARSAAEKAAQAARKEQEERQARDEAVADSLARVRLEEALHSDTPAEPEPTSATSTPGTATTRPSGRNTPETGSPRRTPSTTSANRDNALFRMPKQSSGQNDRSTPTRDRAEEEETDEFFY